MKVGSFIPTATRMLEENMPMIVAGPPGIGKTQILKQICKSLGSDVWVSHPVTDDPTDYKGFPWMDKGEENQLIANFVPIGVLKQMFEYQGDFGTWLIDDAHMALPATQGAIMQLFSKAEKELNGHKLPDSIRVVMLMNESSHGAGYNQILEPLKSRSYSIIRLEPDLPSFVDHALENDIDHRIITYLHMAQGALCKIDVTRELDNNPNPRTWFHADKILKMNFPEVVQMELLAGAIGRSTAGEFAGFLKLDESMPDPRLILAGKFDNSSSPARTDAAYALTGALARLVDTTTMDNCLRYIDGHLRKEFRRLWHTIVAKSNQEALKCKPYADWAVKNQEWL